MDLLIKILKEIQEISEFLKTPYGMHGEELSRRISELNAYHARLPEIIATAESLLLNARAKASEDLLEQNPEVSATMGKIKIDSDCSNYIKVLKFAERLDSACTHQLDGVRSQLSYLKSLI